MARYAPPQPPFWFRLSRALIVCGVAGHIVLAGLVLQLGVGLWLLADLATSIQIVLWMSLAFPIAVACGLVGQWLLSSIEEELQLLAWAWEPPPARRARRTHRQYHR